MTSSAKTTALTLAGAQERYQGSTVFFYHPTRAWELADVTNVTEGDLDGSDFTLTVRARNGDVLDVPLDSSVVYKVSASIVDLKPNNLLSLPELHNALLLNVLKLRYLDDMVYTCLGEMIVSVNPLKSISLFSDSRMSLYLEHLETAKIPESLPPHLWCVSHRAFVEMHTKRVNYSIITSGESGSGKTEACKIMLRYLCAASEAICKDDRVSARIGNVSKGVLLSNIVMEAFGNAKTVKNDNSSRFGKFMEVQFSASGALVGMRITPFLLERSRVVTCSLDERVFHVFYQLVAGASADLKKRLHLGEAKDFTLLCKGKCVSLKASGVDDGKDFVALSEALGSIGFDQDEQDAVWAIVAAVLHLQNIEFEERRVDNTAYLTPEGVETAHFVAASLLSLPKPDLFVNCLTKSVTTVGGEQLTRQYSLHRAKDQRDSICKFIYSKLFLYVVHKVNSFTSCTSAVGGTDQKTALGEGDPKDVTPQNWVALLDIFGFEDFPTNSFEQFCINLANEALQRHYSQSMFVLDTEALRSEKVNPETVAFHDNQPCLNLMQAARNSVISFLDDASTLDMERAQTNPDFVFLGKLTSAHRPDYQSAGAKISKSVLDRDEKMQTPTDYFVRGRLDDNTFTIRHYAGDIRYNVNGFVAKNTDVVRESSSQVLQATTNWVIKSILSTAEEEVGLLGDDKTPISPMSPRGSMMSSTGGGAPRRTVASTFRSSLRMLMEMLNSSSCNWVRCLRPHSRSMAGLFDGKLVLEQLVATGVLSTIAQRQRNFPYRIPHADFAVDFHIVAMSHLRGIPKDAVEDRCRAILTCTGVKASEVQMGKTRVFLRAAGMQQLETLRAEQRQIKGKIITTFLYQRLANVYVASLRFHRMARRLQMAVRTMLRIRRCIRQYAEEVARRRHARFLQAQREILRHEGLRRGEIVTESDSLTKVSWRLFRAQLVPLVAAVLDNVRSVESTRRAELQAVESSLFKEIFVSATKNAAESKWRERERVQALLRRHREERDACLADAMAQHEVMELAEVTERQRLMAEVITPGLEVLMVQAARIHELNKWRDEEVGKLRQSYKDELRRLTVAETVRVELEAETWRRLVGEEQYHRDVLYFFKHTAGSGSVDGTRLPQMDIFFRKGIPSAVVSSPPLGRQTNRRGLGAVNSFAGYREYMQSEYQTTMTKLQSARGVRGKGTPAAEWRRKVPPLPVHVHDDANAPPPIRSSSGFGVNGPRRPVALPAGSAATDLAPCHKVHASLACNSQRGNVCSERSNEDDDYDELLEVARIRASARQPPH